MRCGVRLRGFFVFNHLAFWRAVTPVPLTPRYLPSLWPARPRCALEQ
jgi:hypothetical protein